jgi:hypothetical protein
MLEKLTKFELGEVVTAVIPMFRCAQDGANLCFALVEGGLFFFFFFAAERVLLDHESQVWDAKAGLKERTLVVECDA